MSNLNQRIFSIIEEYVNPYLDCDIALIRSKDIQKATDEIIKELTEREVKLVATLRYICNVPNMAHEWRTGMHMAVKEAKNALTELGI